MLKKVWGIFLISIMVLVTSHSEAATGFQVAQGYAFELGVKISGMSSSKMEVSFHRYKVGKGSEIHCGTRALVSARFGHSRILKAKKALYENSQILFVEPPATSAFVCTQHQKKIEPWEPCFPGHNEYKISHFEHPILLAEGVVTLLSCNRFAYSGEAQPISHEEIAETLGPSIHLIE